MSHWLFALRSYRRKSRRTGLTLRQEIALATLRAWRAKWAFKPGAEERIREAAGQLKGPMDTLDALAAIKAIVAAELAD
jgi:hypothetical protein